MHLQLKIAILPSPNLQEFFKFIYLSLAKCIRLSHKTAHPLFILSSVDFLSLLYTSSPVPVYSSLNQRVITAGLSRDRRTTVLKCSLTWTLNWRRINCEWQNIVLNRCLRSIWFEIFCSVTFWCKSLWEFWIQWVDNEIIHIYFWYFKMMFFAHTVGLMWLITMCCRQQWYTNGAGYCLSEERWKQPYRNQHWRRSAVLPVSLHCPGRATLSANSILLLQVSQSLFLIQNDEAFWIVFFLQKLSSTVLLWQNFNGFGTFSVVFSAVLQVFDNTPAALDGTLAAGDEITGVNGKPVKGKTKVEVAKMIQAVQVHWCNSYRITITVHSWETEVECLNIYFFQFTFFYQFIFFPL